MVINTTKRIVKKAAKKRVRKPVSQEAAGYRLMVSMENNERKLYDAEYYANGIFHQIYASQDRITGLAPNTPDVRLLNKEYGRANKRTDAIRRRQDVLNTKLHTLYGGK